MCQMLVVDRDHLWSRSDVGDARGTVLEGQQPLAGTVESAGHQGKPDSVQVVAQGSFRRRRLAPPRSEVGHGQWGRKSSD